MLCVYIGCTTRGGVFWLWFGRLLLVQYYFDIRSARKGNKYLLVKLCFLILSWQPLIELYLFRTVVLEQSILQSFTPVVCWRLMKLGLLGSHLVFTILALGGIKLSSSRLFFMLYSISKSNWAAWESLVAGKCFACYSSVWFLISLHF